MSTELTFQAASVELRKMRKVFDAFSRVDKILSTAATAEKRVRALEQTVAKLQPEIDDLTNRRDRILAEIAEAKRVQANNVQNIRTELAAEKNTAQREARQKRASLNKTIQDKEAQIARLDKDYQAKVAEYSKQISAATSELATIRASIASLKESIGDVAA